MKSQISFTGCGLHTGLPARVSIRPAMAEHGIWFRRTDIDVGDTLVPASWDAVTESPLCTTIANGAGVCVSSVEHLMAALAGCGVHNALIEIDGPEVPILDGSALMFVQGIMQRGLRQLPVPLRVFEVLEPVSVRSGNAVASIAPSDCMRIDFQIEFEDPAIGCQNKKLVIENGNFATELSDSRTFCCESDIEKILSSGLGRGGIPGQNAIVFDGDRVVSPGGLRHSDEPVRHKMLDALGDIALAGAPLIGHYVGVRAGHALTNKLLCKLFTMPDAVRMVECHPENASRLPGHGLVWSEIPAVA